MYPWICGRCAREFDHGNVHELKVHHKDHNTTTTRRRQHWDCCACTATTTSTSAARAVRLAHDAAQATGPRSTHTPFADLASLLGKDD